MYSFFDVFSDGGKLVLWAVSLSISLMLLLYVCASFKSLSLALYALYSSYLNIPWRCALCLHALIWYIVYIGYCAFILFGAVFGLLLCTMFKSILKILAESPLLFAIAFFIFRFSVFRLEPKHHQGRVKCWVRDARCKVCDNYARSPASRGSCTVALSALHRSAMALASNSFTVEAAFPIYLHKGHGH